MKFLHILKLFNLDRDDQGKHVNYLKNKKYFDLKKKENPIKTDADEMIEMINSKLYLDL